MAVDPPDTDQQPRVGSYSVSPFLKPEVSDQVRNRDPKKRVSWNWYDTWQEEHFRAFVVAKLCKADLLQEVHQSIQKAVDTGMTFAEWKKEVTPKLKGEWLGRTYGDIWENDLGRDIEDLPENQRDKKISPRRLETIYRTNMKVAHAAGQYQSLKDMSDLYPYWRYCTVDDGRMRDEHMAMHNKVFRHDDPIWDTHYPPNGWNCRCYVRAMDEDDLEEAGLTVTDSRDLKKINFEGEQSGKKRLAYGIGKHVMDTDDGWNYNPGNVNAQVAAMAKKKFDKYEPPLKSEVLNAFEQKIDEVKKQQANKLLQVVKGVKGVWNKAKDAADKFRDGLHEVYDVLNESVQDIADRVNETLNAVAYAVNPQPRFALATAGGYSGGYTGASNRFMARNEGGNGGGGKSGAGGKQTKNNAVDVNRGGNNRYYEEPSPLTKEEHEEVVKVFCEAFCQDKNDSEGGGKIRKLVTHLTSGLFDVDTLEFSGGHLTNVFNNMVEKAEHLGMEKNSPVPGLKVRVDKRRMAEDCIKLIDYELNDYSGKESQGHKTLFVGKKGLIKAAELVKQAYQRFVDNNGYPDPGTKWKEYDDLGNCWTGSIAPDGTPTTLNIVTDRIKKGGR